MHNYLPYNKALKQFSRDLRNHSTLGEILLWKKLRARSMGYQFYRQKPLENYIVDFYCQALQLIIEIDGDYHNNTEAYNNDRRREQELNEFGLNFLRFREMEVRSNVAGVQSEIEKYIYKFEMKHPDCLQHKSRRSNPPTASPEE